MDRAILGVTRRPLGAFDRLARNFFFFPPRPPAFPEGGGKASRAYRRVTVKYSLNQIGVFFVREKRFFLWLPGHYRSIIVARLRLIPLRRWMDPITGTSLPPHYLRYSFASFFPLPPLFLLFQPYPYSLLLLVRLSQNRDLTYLFDTGLIQPVDIARLATSKIKTRVYSGPSTFVHNWFLKVCVRM